MSDNTVKFHSQMVGLTYVTSSLIGLLNTFYVKPRGYAVETLQASEIWFRCAQALDLMMFGLVLWMALAIYLSARHINQNLAKFALLFRFAEVVIGCCLVLVTYMALFVLKGNSPGIFTDDQAHAMARMFFELSNAGWAIHLCFLSIGASIYFYLLYVSKGIPRWLNYWGLFTYATVFLGFAFKLLLPNFPDQLMFIMAPGALFELVFGFWMLIKGVSLKNHVSVPR